MKKSAEPSVYAGTVLISLLGGFSLEMNGATLTDDINRSLKLWSVLAYLVLHRNRPVPQSEFIELFWPEDNSSNPVNALKTLLYRIRAMLEPLFGPEIQPILAQRGAYSWNPAVTCELDADRFEALCFQASNEDLPDAARIELYRQAVALYQGRSAAQAKPSDVADPSLGPLSYAVPRGREGPGRPTGPRRALRRDAARLPAGQQSGQSGRGPSHPDRPFSPPAGQGRRRPGSL